MDGYIDIHNHSLPCLDDGAGSVDESVSMVNRAASDGILAVICTPHYKHGIFTKTKELIKTSRNMLLQRLEDVNKKSENNAESVVELYLGNEVHYSGECIELLERDRLNTLAGSRYVLTEFSEQTYYSEMRKAVNRMTAHGFFPILAHVERYRNLSTPGQVRELTELGAYIQINAQSVLGERGHAAKSFCRKLLKRELVHFIASDAHNNSTRPPLLSSCASYVEKKYGAGYANELFLYHALKVLKNEII